MLKPMNEYVSTAFEVCTRAGEILMCFPVVISCSCDISERIYMSLMEQNVMVRRLCARHMAQMSDIQNLWTSQFRQNGDISQKPVQGWTWSQRIRNEDPRCRERSRFFSWRWANAKNCFIVSVNLILEIIGLEHEGTILTWVLCLRFSHCSNLDFRVTKMLEEYMASYHSSDSNFWSC